MPTRMPRVSVYGQLPPDKAAAHRKSDRLRAAAVKADTAVENAISLRLDAAEIDRRRARAEKATAAFRAAESDLHALYFGRTPSLNLDDDLCCVCGTYRSEHALCGCEQFERASTPAERIECAHCHATVGAPPAGDPNPELCADCVETKELAGRCRDCLGHGLLADYDPHHSAADHDGFVFTPCSCPAGERFGPGPSR